MPKEKLILARLPYSRDTLEPVLSKVSLDVHYGTLTKNYVTKYNKTGDPFQRAGYILHELWWANLRVPTAENKPTGESEKLLRKKFRSVEAFMEAFTEAATTIKGNGWCVVIDSGKIVQIPNHKLLSTPIILLVDMFEHSYFLDYKADKEKYIDNMWKIINWDVVNDRLSK